MSTEIEANTYIRFWAPFTASYEEADYSIQFKPPEEGNTEKRARNQSIVRNRAGSTFVYDRGNNYNTNFSLNFEDVPDTLRAQLVVFLEAIQWATTKVLYQDVYGTTYVVRILGEDGIQYTDNGLRKKRGKSEILWNFSLDLLNLTDNSAELETVDPVPTNALLLHIQDTNDPHSPTLVYDIDNADGAVVLDSVKTNEWRGVLWTILLAKGTASASYIVSAHHNRTDLSTDATTVEQIIETMCEQGDVTAHATITVELNGTGTAQIMRIKADMDTDGWKLEIRKIKLGSAENIYE